MILVDEARWPWRDDYWCHLVSDDNLAELHAFAGRLGARRVGFQGDHYDINVATRARAIELGATACTSRELVRRLRAAGLRLRPSSYEKWDLRARFDDAPSSEIMAEFTAGASPQATAVLNAALPFADGAFVLQRTGSSASIVHGRGSSPVAVSDVGEWGLYSRIDLDGTWSVEVFDPPPADSA